MASKQMIFTGDKESFIVRVLIKKTKDAGIESSFVPCTVDDISASGKDIQLIVLYMEDGTFPKENILHFLTDSLEEREGKLVLIGDQDNISFVCDRVPGEIIYKTYTRPVDNSKFAENVSDFFEKIAHEEFKKHILIVDDDPQYLSLVRQWLKGTYKVSMANSGLQAIKFLGKNKADLILLDHEMPVTSGPQVLEMLRSDEQTSSIPVMFLTGKSDKKSVMEVVALRPEGYFLKSITREELLEKLKEYFAIHRLGS